MRYVKSNLCLLVMLLAAVPMWAQNEITVTTTIDKQRIHVGDPIEFTISITKHEEVRVVLPDDEIKPAPFDLLGIRRTVEQEEGSEIEKLILTVSIYETGNFEIPSIEIPYVTANETEKHVTTDPVPVVVDTVLTEEDQQLRDPKAPADVNPRAAYPLGLLALVIITAALLIAAFRWWRRYRIEKKQIDEERIEQSRPPGEVALEAITALRSKNLPAKGEVKPFYVEAVEIFKRYLQDRYAVSVIERTTGEIKRDFRKSRLTGKEQHVVFSVLDEADLVKFARHRPPMEECSQFLDRIESYIRSSRENFEPDDHPVSEPADIVEKR